MMKNDDLMKRAEILRRIDLIEIENEQLKCDIKDRDKLIKELEQQLVSKMASATP